MFEHLQNQNLKIRQVIAKLRVKKVAAAEIDRLDPEHLSFFNINTQEDLKRAEGLKIRMGQENG